MHVAAHKALPLIAGKRAGQQARLAKNLKAVAHAQHQAARAGKARHGRHEGRESGDGARAQRVPVRKTAGHDHRPQVGRQLSVRIPQINGLGGAVHRFGHGMSGVGIAVRARKYNHGHPATVMS